VSLNLEFEIFMTLNACEMLGMTQFWWVSPLLLPPIQLPQYVI
jgi:hypothetical protein